MALPLITTESLIQAFRSRINNVPNVNVEIFSEFPQDMTNVRHGIYVGHPITSSRLPYSLAVNYGGNIYICDDMVDVIFVSFQGDPIIDIVTEIICSIVTDNVLLDGYHERDFTISSTHKNRAEYRTTVFNLKRMEIQ